MKINKNNEKKNNKKKEITKFEREIKELNKK